MTLVFERTLEEGESDNYSYWAPSSAIPYFYCVRVVRPFFAEHLRGGAQIKEADRPLVGIKGCFFLAVAS